MGADKKVPTDPNATMAVTPSMVLPLASAANATMAVTSSMVLPVGGDANVTMMFTPDMVVNDSSIVMGRGQIERALAVVALWHKAVMEGDVETVIATCADDIEIIDP